MPEGTELVNLEVKALVKPAKVSEKEEVAIKRQAEVAVKELLALDGSAAVRASDQIANVGIKDQRTISDKLALLQEKVGKIIVDNNNRDSTTGQISKDMDELNLVLAKINPKDVQRETIFHVLRMIPFAGDRMVKILETIAKRRETLQSFIDHLDASLSHGSSMLSRDNEQLMLVYEEIESKQKTIIMNAYLAEVLAEKLKEELKNTTDEKRKALLNRLVFRVSTRVQDLWAMDNINAQHIISIDMAKSNNEDMISAVGRMQTLGMDVIRVAFTIQAALSRTKDVIKMYEKTRVLIGDTLVSNANAINQNVKELGDIYNEPFIAMNKLETSCNILKEAISNLNKMQIEGIRKSAENTTKIKILTEDLNKSSGAPVVVEIKSIEASNLQQLPVGRDEK